MNSRSLIAVAVAAACAWPTVAAAARDSYSGDAGHWAVITPSSVDESAPWKAADSATKRGPHHGTLTSSDRASTFAEVITPLSVSESAPWLTAQQTRARNTRLQSASLANPQTPWSPNESGTARYTEEMRARAQHVASVDQTRGAIARMEAERLAEIERERLASIERERLATIERERLASAPEGGAGAAAVATGTPGAIDSTTAPANTSSNAPAAPGERPTQSDQTAGLVDTRSGSMSLATPEAGSTGPSSTPPSDAERQGNAAASVTDRPVIEPAATSAAIAPSLPARELTATEVSPAVGATRGEGASVSGTGPVVNERAGSPSVEANVSTAAGTAETAAAASGSRTPADPGQTPSASENAAVNAYITLHGTSPDVVTR